MCGKFICIWRQRCGLAGACRSVLHTQETPNTHKAFRIAASNPWGSKTDEEVEGL